MPGIRSTHFVCPPCRTALKRPVGQPGPPPPCAHCGHPMTDAGPQLAVPPRRDADGWAALAAVLEAGLRFPAIGCEADGPGYRPRTMREVEERRTAAHRTGRPVAEMLATRDPWDEDGPAHAPA
ncbi:deoxyxylulose-5-phosphate synthase [Streptomyces sp. NBC_01775]|uniref:deoxyxylulose-5-phosphate synthase n=1 Tax=Streptomyces sp. NBC_01775 TaxID=2975939 RepID=UPI002DDC2857|nr:deoxyxylulose-5-phosphate synthase [Streptomyces sp. NBC_01775]WSB79062.1 deoxyxylulose-5-phosphate synthase [Streptomyces sp. NBC_01775]